jgi:hypothetical protein
MHSLRMNPATASAAAHDEATSSTTGGQVGRGNHRVAGEEGSSASAQALDRHGGSSNPGTSQRRPGWFIVVATIAFAYLARAVGLPLLTS